jgi:hypothetical protein
VVLASSSAGQPFAGVYTQAAGWKGQLLTEPDILGRPVVVATGGGKAQALVRVFAENKELLWSASWSGGSWGAFGKVGPGYEAQDGPSYSVSSQTSWATYRRGGKHFALTFKGGSFGAEGPLGADNPQAFGNSHAAVSVSGATAWGAYAGGDQGLYVVLHGGSSWTESAPIFGAGTKNYITPALIHDDKAQPTVFFVRNSDSKICLVVRDGNGWSQPSVVANDAITDSSPVAVQTTSGMYLVWRGFIGDDGIYFSFRPSGGAWQAPKAVDSDNGATTLPALTPGTKGADAELVYVKNGQLRHARFTGGTSTSPSVIPGTFNMQEASAARVE